MCGHYVPRGKCFEKIMTLVKGIEKAGENTKLKKGQKASANFLSGGIVFYESCIFNNKNRLAMENSWNKKIF